MPLVLQVQASGDTAAGLFQSSVELPEPVEPDRLRPGREPQRERLERAQDGADLPQLGGVERLDPKAPAHGILENPVACEADQGFPDRCPADAELRGDGDVPNARAGSEVTPFESAHKLAMDLIPERNAGNHG